MPQHESADLFRQPLAQRIDLRHPLAVLASRLPWAQIEAALAPHFARQVREGRAVAQTDLFGPSIQVAGAGVAAAGRPRLPMRLMASLLYLKHAYKLPPQGQEQAVRPARVRGGVHRQTRGRSQTLAVG